MEIEISDVKWPRTLFEESEPRQPGTHLSDVIKSLEIKSGLRPNPKGGFNDMELTAEIGLLWERVLGKVMAEKYAVRPPQICEDGIWMSPDGIGEDPDGKVPMVLEEYKAAWKSTRSSPADNFKYMTQVKMPTDGYAGLV